MHSYFTPVRGRINKSRKRLAIYCAQETVMVTSEFKLAHISFQGVSFINTPLPFLYTLHIYATRRTKCFFHTHSHRGTERNQRIGPTLLRVNSMWFNSTIGRLFSVIRLTDLSGDSFALEQGCKSSGGS